MTQALGQMSGVLLALWGIVFLLLAAGLVWALRMEARRSRVRGRFAAWAVFRVLTLPLLALVLWLALQPARAVSGMEGLAYAYGGLLVLGPTLWFGSHVLLGWLQRPTLKAGESIEFAGFGLLFVLGPVLLVASLQAPVFLLAHAVEHGLRSATPSAAAAHRAGAMRRFHLGEGTELLSWSLHAPAGLRVERLEMFAGAWVDASHHALPTLCRMGEDLHLAWAADAPAPRLRVFWRDAGGPLRQSIIEPDRDSLSAAQAEPFVVRWQADGFDLPVPLSRFRIQPGWRRDDGSIEHGLLDEISSGEADRSRCVATYHVLPTVSTAGQLAVMRLRLWPSAPDLPDSFDFIAPIDEP